MLCKRRGEKRKTQWRDAEQTVIQSAAACLFTAAAVQCADICVNVSLEKSQAPLGVCVNNNTVIHPLLI